MKIELPITEDLDFSYLLGLMRPLHNIDEYASLPELFTLLGYKSVIDLCIYCGGETIRIPTIEELNHSIDSLQWFYDVYIKKSKDQSEIPLDLIECVSEIRDIYDARES